MRLLSERSLLLDRRMCDVGARQAIWSPQAPPALWAAGLSRSDKGMFVLLLHRLDNKTSGFARLLSNIKYPFLPDLPLPVYKKILLQLLLAH